MTLTEILLLHKEHVLSEHHGELTYYGTEEAIKDINIWVEENYGKNK